MRVTIVLGGTISLGLGFTGILGFCLRVDDYWPLFSALGIFVSSLTIGRLIEREFLSSSSPHSPEPTKPE